MYGPPTRLNIRTRCMALFGGGTASLQARVGVGLTFAPHASTAHFSAPIMFTALNSNAFGKTSAGLGAAAEGGEAEVVLLIAASGGREKCPHRSRKVSSQI